MPDCPLLDSIGGPEDVRALPTGKLLDLARELRARITEVVGERGGHLASGLGVVELTIALHRAFDFRHDRLVWDVGHQCYAHKLLTGRRERFGTLRTRGGVSGFPNPAESEYDLFVTGHASTSVSTALGLACAEGPSPASTASSAVKDARPRVVAVVGDGAMGGGLAFEGLNHAGHLGLDLLVILNDNEMSIARSVGALSRHLSRVRLDPHYNELREGAARRAFTGGGIFQDLGFRYIGPVDGHDLGGLEAALGSARDLKGPVLLHVYTQKGRGYGPAAFDPTRYHSAAPFKIRIEGARDERTGPGGEFERAPPRTYAEAMARTLAEIGRADDRVVAVTAAMANGTG
ncbi:MAG: 1-deoxy-D-xylulose-5-phosphate synthase N-terminal domain-containing protein, partial [Planctomycetota bacterium]